MRTIIRNFLSTLKRFKMASILNILGLSVAFAAFAIIMIQLNYERQFDKVHPTSDRIFRVDLPNEEGVFSMILPRPFIEDVMRSSPHIKAATIINPFIGQVYFTVNDRGEKRGFRKKFTTCSSDITKVFDFPIIDGDINCLKDPDKVIIPLSVAHALFGETSAIGKAIHCEEPVWSKTRTDMVVGGVYRDFPENTQLSNDIYTAMDPDFSMDNWSASNYLCYLLLDNAKDSQSVVDNFNKNYDYSKLEWNDSKKEIGLTLLTDIYYENESKDGNIVRSGSKESANLILVIGILVIVVATINFMNFSTSLAPLRIKSINTQKTLGCPDSILRITLVSEAVSLAIISYMISILIIWILNETTLLSFFDADLSISRNIPLLLICGVVAFIVGVLAGLYPAFYMTSFSPAMVLKGSFSVSPAGRRLRTALIGFQFIVSIGLIIASSFVWLQNNYMQKYSLGFDRDQIAIVELGIDFYKNYRETYTNQLKAYSGIEDVAFSRQKLGSRDTYSSSSTTYKEQTFNYYMLDVSWNFADVMGIPLVGGRKASPTDEKGANMSFILNKDLQQKYNIETETPIQPFENSSIIGFVDNVKFTSLRQGNDNIVLTINNPWNTLPVSYIRLKAGTDYFAAVNHISKTISQLDPTYPFEVEFYDSLFNQLYHKEENLRKMITLFSLLTIIIAIVGVFGLVIFDTESRRKEISIRKVHGATIGEILVMFNKTYFYIICTCFAIAIPLIYYGITKWLEGFAYRTPIYWWVFLVGGLVIFLITAATVSIQSWRAASTNPVDSLKTE
ncbi:ABC transporter permease [Dysgonomonas sp. ZJ279]|uniref:ABC transporter permease n=1 Tax=Dysgonomonas sp. ZJ279 TaxID=2709796 RepID=UPI0013ED2A26|nr:ABC transporter permease [Dysgonomonas sp. ZJ279]